MFCVVFFPGCFTLDSAAIFMTGNLKEIGGTNSVSECARFCGEERQWVALVVSTFMKTHPFCLNVNLLLLCSTILSGPQSSSSHHIMSYLVKHFLIFVLFTTIVDIFSLKRYVNVFLSDSL